jgi:DNA invertase Pin-like site-specific DNA recombinase
VSFLNIGVDYIGISIIENVSGFKGFLRACGGILTASKRGQYGHIYLEFHLDGTDYEARQHNKRLYLFISGLTEYKYNSYSKDRWLFLQRLYRHYPSMNIREVHVALDVPYSYSSIRIRPQKHIFLPRFKSTKYFDIRQSDTNQVDYHNFVIYDKCRKCKLAMSLTRIELRVTPIMLYPYGKGIIRHKEDQHRLALKIQNKFSKIVIKKNRTTIDTSSLEWEKLVLMTMQFIQGDNSLLDELLSHRSRDIVESSILFSKYLRYCRTEQIYSSKPLSASKDFMNVLTPQKANQISTTIAGYNAYDRRWFQDPRFRLKELEPKVRPDESVHDEAIFLYQLGQTQRSIAKELSVHESTISKWFKGLRRLKDSTYMFKVHT